MEQEIKVKANREDISNECEKIINQLDKYNIAEKYFIIESLFKTLVITIDESGYSIKDNSPSSSCASKESLK